MKHPREIELIRFARGEQEGPSAAEIANHIGRCSACRRLVDEQRRVGAALEVWQPERPDAELWARIEGRIEAGEPRVIVSPWARAGRVARVAAAVVLAVGCGHLAGRMTWWTPLPPEPAPLTEEQAAEVLGLDELVEPSASGIADAWFGLIADEDEEGRP